MAATRSWALQVYHYLKAYAETFQLEQLVQFRTTVVRARPVAASQSAAASEAAARSVPDAAQPITNGNGGATQNGAGSANGGTTSGSSTAVGSSSIEPGQQRWQVTTAPAGLKGGQGGGAGGQSTHVFDALLVCNGHFSEPRLPDAAGASSLLHCSTAALACDCEQHSMACVKARCTPDVPMQSRHSIGATCIDSSWG